MKRSVWVLAIALCGCSAERPTATRGPGASVSRSNGPVNPLIVGPGAAKAGSAGSASPLLSTSGPKLINDPNVCASAQVTASRITPTVQLVIDGSSSMNSPFGSGTRWSVLRDTLIGPMGVVSTLQSVVNFGMAIYSSNAECPAMSEVAPALDNLMPITAAYPMTEPGVGTPTGEALQKVVDSLPDFSLGGGPDMKVETAPIIILATDGEPNGCAAGALANCDLNDLASCLAQLTGPATYDSTLAAVRAARDKQIPVWVVSLADGLNSIPQLQTTANIGAGLADDASPGATIYSPQSADELTTTLTSLIGAATSCDVTLAGTLDITRACEGEVRLNGNPLTCNDADGWAPVDATHIALQGASCDSFKSNPSVLVDARFPCDVVELK